MDNLTHSLVGLAVAKAGVERLSPAATAVCVVAANAPDADIVTAFGGSWTYLHNHRGLTHSIIGVCALALVVPLLFWGMERFVIARYRREPPRVRLRGLVLASCVATATHPLLDWMNNYGVRPLLPWSGEWYYGDLMFIVDPWIWLSVGGAAFLLTAQRRVRLIAWALLAVVLTVAVLLFSSNPLAEYPFASRMLWVAGIVGLVVAHWTGVARRWGRSIACGALALVLVYWAALALAHDKALARAQAFAARGMMQSGETLARVAAMPTLANPLRWRCVAETNRATYRFEVSLAEAADEYHTSAEARRAGVLRYAKSQGAEQALVARAAMDERARIFLDFARFPVTRVKGDCARGASVVPLVQFADLRYTEPGSGANGRGNFSLEVPVPCQSSAITANTE